MIRLAGLAFLLLALAPTAVRAARTSPEEAKALSGTFFGEVAPAAPAAVEEPAARAPAAEPRSAAPTRPEELEPAPAPPAPFSGRPAGRVRATLADAADGTFNALCRGIGLSLIGAAALFVLGAEFLDSAKHALVPRRKRGSSPR